jgi:hypothetical protein
VVVALVDRAVVAARQRHKVAHNSSNNKAVHNNKPVAAVVDNVAVVSVRALVAVEHKAVHNNKPAAQLLAEHQAPLMRHEQQRQAEL